MVEHYAGHVVLPADTPVAENANLVVEIRDVSLTDAPAPLMATVAIRGVGIGPGVSIPFSLDGPVVPPGRSFAFQAYLRTGDLGATSSPDFLTTQSIPAIPGHVVLPVTRIR
ncbi:YbaY family lipoprotein [Rhizobium leguminosarum]|uniref:YbaY family lipoprotein n=1 Tax=Rhizobium TaxID=379 RepID=UPI0013EEB467|nr:YbaY family lipoprotein [Rhizobium leguminosarum]